MEDKHIHDNRNSTDLAGQKYFEMLIRKFKIRRENDSACAETWCLQRSLFISLSFSECKVDACPSPCKPVVLILSEHGNKQSDNYIMQTCGVRVTIIEIFNLHIDM